MFLLGGGSIGKGLGLRLTVGADAAKAHRDVAAVGVNLPELVRRSLIQFKALHLLSRFGLLRHCMGASAVSRGLGIARPKSTGDAIVNAWTSLLETGRKDLVLMFDEFQAIAEAKDSDAIAAALRSALTQVSSKVGVVFSGSSQHLLLEMFSRAQTPLYNFANTEPYPLLKDDFIGHVAKKVAAATQRDFNQAIALRVLESMGHQPAPFLNAVSNAMSKPGWTVQDGLKVMLDPKVANQWSSAWYGLTDLQRITLRIAHEGELLTSALTLKLAALELGQAKVQASSLTRAMETVMDKGLVEREPSSRRYLISDPVMTAWLNHNKGLPVRVA
jgi:hypothetical protein